MISKIKSDSGFANLVFMEITLQVKILDSGFIPYRSFIVGFHERGKQIGSLV
jgi:hypothetical protein